MKDEAYAWLDQCRDSGSHVALKVRALDANGHSGMAIVAAALLLLWQVYALASRLASGVGVWTRVLVPVWVLDAALALFLAAQLMIVAPYGGSDEERDDAFYAKVQALAALIVLAMVFASELMLANKLDGRDATRTYHEVFGPLYAGVAVMATFGAALLYSNWPDDSKNSVVYSSGGVPYG